MAAVDARTPVIVGAGQAAENIEDPGYRGMSSVELATAAAQAALSDTGADVSAVARAIETYSVRYDWPIRTGIIVGLMEGMTFPFRSVTEVESSCP